MSRVNSAAVTQGKLARPIVIPVRQNFNVNMEFFAVGTTDVLTALINGGAADNQKCVIFMVDGQRAAA